MLKITKETDYAVLLLVEIAQQSGHNAKPLNVSALSERSSIPPAMVSKTLKAMAQAQLLTSVRGPQGGYLLGHSANQITMQAVVEALEGPISLTECIDESHDCCAAKKSADANSDKQDNQSSTSGCNVSPYWHHINQVICESLAAINLQMLIDHKSPNVSVSLSNLGKFDHPIQFARNTNQSA